jgi:glycosyltransferase involved in cell wall biosynthesis
MPELRAALELVSPQIAVIIPTLDEAQAIGGVIAEIPRPPVDEIIVADSGSRDGTAGIAQAAGARVVALAERGYGRACAAGVAATDADILVFMDGDGADRADLLPVLIAPLLAGEADFVLAARHKAGRAPGSMSAHQVIAGHVLGRGIQALTGQAYTDMCAFRAITRSAYERLGMSEMTYGWNIEMQMQAARLRLRIREIPLPYRVRAGGESKVAGSLRGTVKASWRILSTFVRLANRRPGAERPQTPGSGQRR